jgi:uncharacterized protein YndB with AHSA1/START domain
MVLKAIMVTSCVAAVGVGIVLAIAAAKPATFQIRRSIAIAAPPVKVYWLICDFHNWPQWAPQDREDPTMLRTYSGAPSGVGAVSEWTSKGTAGTGKMEVSEAQASSRLTVQTYFQKPFRAHNVNEFSLEPEGAGTTVTWTMHGPNLFPMKVMATFVDMDRMMGEHFDNGLRNLKAAAEPQ